MARDPEEETINNTESPEKTEEFFTTPPESPEKTIETPEQLDHLAAETTEKIKKTAESVKAQGLEEVGSVHHKYEADPDEMKDVRQGLSDVHKKIDDLVTTNQGKVSNITEKKAASKEMFEQLKPHEIIDEEGVERDIYNFTTIGGKEVKTLFYSPDELPFSDKMVDGRQAFIIGDRPKARTDQEWNDFCDTIRHGSKADISPTTGNPVDINEPRSQGKASFFVESSPQALLDMAFYLGVEDKRLREMRRVLSQGETNKEIKQLMDKVIAGKLFDSEGNFRTKRNYEGEVLLLLALQGDADASQKLEKRATLLRQHDEKVQKEIVDETASMNKKGSREHETVEALDPKELVAVHTTKFKPKKVGDGYRMQSTYDASQGETLRNSIHFTLNHHVASHMYGNWDHSPYVALSPFDKMIETNGKPANINTVDTYFEQNPHTPLTLPEGTYIVQPGKMDAGELFQINEDGSVVYQENELGQDDLASLEQKISPEKMYSIESNVITAIENAIRHRVQFDDETLNKDYNERYVLAHKVKDVINDLWKESDWKSVFLAQCKKQGISAAVNQLTDNAGLSKVLHETEKTQLREAVQNALRSEIKKIAVKETISHMGYENHSGGMWAWDGDDWDGTTAAVKLAHRLGVKTGPHSSRPEARLTEEYYNAMTEFKEGKSDIRQLREDSEDINSKYLDKISPQTRRILYQRGML